MLPLDKKLLLKFVLNFKKRELLAKMCKIKHLKRKIVLLSLIISDLNNQMLLHCIKTGRVKLLELKTADSFLLTQLSVIRFRL